MSLNGLDAADVLEAYQSAITDPGGWFLLRYVSRDGVELLARGKGGVHEARMTIGKYQEASPLYGLLIYRRRRVLIKYIPEGTSRVLQARTAVHFQDIVERYSPYETLLEITTAEGLNDTSLAAAFPLHTATSSVNASRLHEISEDAEDAGSQPAKQSNNGSIFGTRQYKMERRVEQVMRPDRAPPVVSSLGDGGKTSIASQILVREDSGQRSITSVSSPLSESFTEYAASTAPSDTVSSRAATSKTSLSSEAPRSQPQAQTAVAEPPQRKSVSPVKSIEPVLEKPLPTPEVEPSQSLEKPKKTEEEPFDFSYLEPKQKVRLAPRPVAPSVQAKRATTTGVSALPAHYRPVAKKQEAQPSPPYYNVNKNIPSLPVPPIPDAPEYNPRPISRGSVRSLTSQKNNAMTPDKIRLMKAVELRKKQLRKSNSQLPASIPGVGAEGSAVPEVPQIPEQPRQEVKVEELPRHVLQEEEAANKADSGIEMEYERQQAAAADGKSDDPMTAEALRNDEIKAEEEGYGAVPTEDVEDKQPRLQRVQSPASDNTVTELSPSSDYSDAKTDLPVSVAAAQDATEAFNRSVHTTDAQAAAESSRLPTIVMSPGSPPASSHGQSLPIASAEAGAAQDESDSHSTLDVQQSPRRQNSDLAKRRRGFVEPLALDEQSEMLVDDDDFMDELQSANVQEARSMSVARSPVAAYFPRRPSNQSLVSATSHPSEQSLTALAARNVNVPSPREASPAPVEQEDRTPNDSIHRRSISPIERDSHAGLKRNVSSGIAKRFQALSETSTPTSPQERAFAERPIRTPPRTRTSSYRNKWSAHDRTSSPNPATSPYEAAPSWSMSQDGSGNRDSINVRARIVRPSQSVDSHPDKPEQEEAVPLQQSQIEISRSAKVLPPLNSATAARDMHPPASPVSTRRARMQPLSPQATLPEDFPAPPSITSRTNTLTPTTDDGSSTTTKSDSRTTRFFKRMSNLAGSKRRSGATQSISSVQSPIANDSAASVKSMRTPSTVTEQERPDMPPAAALGDLNIQFPDTLLWKRRWLTLDDAGNLILGVSHAKEHQRGAAPRSYRLSEFKLPHIPDLDRQEMPHSVCLDLVDGGTLQIACDESMAQRQVLTILRAYWKSWVG